MRILHLTDLHIGWEAQIENERQIWNRLFQEISKETDGSIIDMIAVTGDLVMHGTEEEYRRTEQYLHHLRNLLGLDKKQVFFCCGNHDSDTPEAGSSFCSYENFLKRFYGDSEKDINGMIAGQYKEGKCSGIQVFCISSCKRTSLQNFNDCWLDPEDVDKILEEAETVGKGILLMHHQPELFDDQTQIKRLNQAVGFILGGHLHSGYTRQYTWKGMTVINGLAVSPHLDFLPRGFQIIEIGDNNQAETWMYVDKGDGNVDKVRA